MKVLTYINSSKFGGLEQETSLLRNNTPNKNSKNSSVCYTRPEKLKDINLSYSKECEMFSFGITLWEIATLKKSFDVQKQTLFNYIFLMAVVTHHFAEKR